MAGVCVAAGSVAAGCYLITPYADLTGGAVEGGPPIVAGFCGALPTDAPSAVFCDDFDGPPLSAKWDLVLVPPASELRIDSAESTSKPSSLLLSVPAGQTANQALYVAKQFDNASSVTVAFDVRLDSVPTADTTYVVEIEMGRDAVLLFVARGAWTLQQAITAGDGSQTFPGFDLSALPTSAWTHVAIAVSAVAGGSSKAVVTFNDTSETVALDPSWAPATFRIRVGSKYVNVPTQSRRVHFDNVRVDAR